MNRTLVVAALCLAGYAGACGAFDDALTGHSRPAATAAGYTLESEELGELMAASQTPDSLLTAYWAGEFARLWADFVVLAVLYQDPDTTRSVDYTRLMEDGRHLAAIAVQRYRNTVVMRGIEPSEQEIREYFDARQPYTRLDVRRVVLTIPEEAEESAQDSLYGEASRIRERLVGGADFVAVARETSSEPTQARGQILAYQGHDDFPAAADSVLFSLQPGEISPVIATDTEFLIYRVEARRAPDFESSRDQLYRLILKERAERRQREALESIIGDARRAVMQGATDMATQIARDPSLAADRIPDGMKLVTWDGGDLSVEELRRLFVVLNSMRELFAEATEEEVHNHLMSLARDEILITAAASSGVSASAEEREALAIGLADQLGHIAARFGLASQLVINPRFKIGEQSYYFLQGVMERPRAIPWLGEFRVVLDPRFPVLVDDSGVNNAARRARELRAAGVVAQENGTPEGEDVEPGPEVG